MTDSLDPRRMPTDDSPDTLSPADAQGEIPAGDPDAPGNGDAYRAPGPDTGNEAIRGAAAGGALGGAAGYAGGLATAPVTAGAIRQAESDRTAEERDEAVQEPAPGDSDGLEA